MKKIILFATVIFSALTVYAQPAVIIKVSGSTNTPITSCYPVLFTASGCTACITYQWKVNGVNIGNNSSTLYTGQSGTYTCTATNASGTSTSNAITFNLVTNAASITSGGPTSFCNNPQQVTLTATNIAGYSYQWCRRTNGTTDTIPGATAFTYLPPINVNDIYAVRVTTQGCTFLSNEIMTSYFSQPPPPQTITADYNQTWFCPVSGGSPILRLPAVLGYSYQWKLNGNNYSSNCSPACAYAGIGVMSCDVSNGCGTVGSSNSITTALLPNPVMGITSGSATACSGFVQFAITNAASFPSSTGYQWKKNGATLTGGTSSSYTATNAGSYTCTVSIPQCSSFTPTAVTIYTTPNITTSDPVTFCSGGATLTASPTGSTFQWLKNGVNLSGATSQTYIATSSGSYTCLVTPPGCSASTSNSLSITSGVSNPLISAPSGYDNCYGGPVTISITNANGAAFQWGKQGLGDIVGATSSSYNATTTYNYYCRVIESCGTTVLNLPSTVRIIPDNDAQLTSASYQGEVCNSALLQINAFNAPYIYNYQWYRDTTAIPQAWAFTYNANQPGIYSCRISMPGCPGSYPIGYPFTSTFLITTIASYIPANTPISPPGTTQTCTGQTVNITIPPCNGCHYNVRMKTGSNSYFTTVSSSDSNVYAFTSYHTPTTYVFYAEVTNECNFASSTYDTIVTTPNFTASITPSGSTLICVPGSVVLNAYPSSGYSYQWYKSNSEIPGATSSSYAATQSGTHKVVLTAPNGCNAYAAVSVTTFTSVPPATISPGGATTFCSGASVVLTANTGSGLTYQWKNNSNDISGATNYNYTVTANGNYTVVVTNACGSATSSSVPVTVNPLPSAALTAGGPTTFCSGGNVVLNAPTGANKTYQWKKGANFISGATLSSYTASTGGSYKVIVTNTVTGCSKTTGSATVVTINALPTATITPQGPTSFCAGGSVVLQANTGAGLTYQWKKGSNFISGATLSNYTATTGGNYKVQVTNSNGCSKTSANVAVSVPCKEGEIVSHENTFNFTIYPNPNSGEFTIKFSNELSSPVQIEMTDELGRVVKRFETDDETVVIKESNLVEGIYYLTLKNNDEMVIKKINIVK